MTETAPGGWYRYVCTVCGPGAVHYDTKGRAETELSRHRRRREHRTKTEVNNNE